TPLDLPVLLLLCSSGLWLVWHADPLRRLLRGTLHFVSQPLTPPDVPRGSRAAGKLPKQEWPMVLRAESASPCASAPSTQSTTETSTAAISDRSGEANRRRSGFVLSAGSGGMKIPKTLLAAMILAVAGNVRAHD